MSSKLKIGLALDDSLDTPDGVQQYVLTVGKWLDAQGHDVHYLVGETSRNDVANVHSLSRNVKVRFNGNRLSLPLPAPKQKLRKFLEQHDFDALHIQMPYSPMLASRIIKVAPERTAILGTFHVLPYSKVVHAANHALALSLRPTLRRFDSIFTVSRAAQEFARKVYKIDSTVLPNVIDESRFKDAKPLSEFIDDRATILFLGRLVPRKGCKTLLAAVKLLSEDPNIPNFKVAIGGKGPLLHELKNYVAENGLTDIATFAGFIAEAEKPDFLASGDLAVFPSSGGESFGIVLLEAMAAAHPLVLAGDNPGYRSVMGEKPDLLFPAKDERALAKKIEKYLGDSKLRKKTVGWQTDYVRQFDVNIVGKKLVQAYRESCETRRKRQ